MADIDGSGLSAWFYGRLFSPIGGEDEMALCERSAGALRDAVGEMRKKEGMTLERWVNLCSLRGIKSLTFCTLP